MNLHTHAMGMGPAFRMVRGPAGGYLFHMELRWQMLVPTISRESAEFMTILVEKGI